MNRLDRYIARNFLMGMVPVLLLLLVLFSFMALAGELEEVGNGLFTLFDAFLVVAYTAPRRIVDLLPVTTLLGGLLGLGAMANHQELIAARVAGMSRSRLARPVLLIGLVLAALVFLAQSFLIPLVEREANEIRARSLVETDVDKSGELEFWTRSENHFVRVNDVRFGRLLKDVEVFSMDNKGRLRQIIQASGASIGGVDDWLLKDVTVTSIEGSVVREQQVDEMSWPGLLSTEQAAILVMPLEALAPVDLWRLTDFQNQNGLDSHRYRVVLWQQLSIAVAVVGMALLTLPLLLGSIRSIPASQRVVIGGFIGIGFYLLQQLSGHLAGLFGLNPAGTIMTPSTILLAVAIYAQFLEAGRKRRAIRRTAGKLKTA
jgi:lipopolysaccharide export system permease protein